MPTICIGVYVHALPDQLHATIESLCAYTPPWAQLVLLPDGPDAATRAALTRLQTIPQLATADARGTAACFNRLIAANNADVLVLLESGALVGPGWLQRLLDALHADPRNGLAGPSTNRCWNEQAVLPDTTDDADAITYAAREVAKRFQDQTRTLEPLYSLADFCYAVTRATVQAVGAADEGYGLGPCWEMDYNIRAARLGFRGVWAGAAYVHRLPPTARRLRSETRLLTHSRRRYQDTFCALRLSGRRNDYEPHCRGDACEHFAPPDFITTRIPLEPVQRDASPVPKPVPPVIELVPRPPLVSCIMPTSGRPDYVLQSIRYFQQQEYAERELIIIDDGPTGLAERLPDDPRIRYQHNDQRRSIGAKRNQACALARGDYIAHWDDDDWYAPTRLSAQIEPLSAGSADVTGLITGLVFDLDRWQFWRCSPRLHQQMFVENVHGGTLVYRRRLWERTARYPDRSLAEDAAFLRQAVRYGARLERIDGAALFIYLRHGTNSWAFPCGSYIDSNQWQRASEPAMLAADRAFYQARTYAPAPDLPLVSCIMPTYNRKSFVAHALRYFQRQDYVSRELIVVDDGDESVEALVAAEPRARYLRLPRRVSLGEKRNIACQAARGELICHWDDDDWMASHRLSYQVSALLQSDRLACGTVAQLYFEPGAARAWLYRHPARTRRWVAGNTLLYRRTAWERQPFAPISIGEDTRFIWNLPPDSLHQLADHRFYVGLIHDDNTSPKRTSASGWHPRPIAEATDLIGADHAAYMFLHPVSE